jgi:hypothetical protein
MTDHDAVLVRVLAAADALLLPVRDWNSHTDVNRESRSRMAGVPYRVSTRGDEAGRKSNEQSLIEITGQGLITLARSTRIRFPLLKLTPKGEARARGLCGLPARIEGRAMLADVAKLSALYREYTIGSNRGRWVPEIDLNDGRGWGEDTTKAEYAALARLELRFLPAASLGWLRASSLRSGNVGYCATAEGLEELARPKPVPDLGKPPERDDDARALYRATDAPEGNTVCLPLSPDAFMREAPKALAGSGT